MTENVDRNRFDRQMFLAAAIAFPLLVLAGFGRTYYLKGFFDAPPLPSSLVHVHGLLMTAWVFLFVTQVWLISAKRIRLHQALGYAGIALGALIIVTGVPTALRAAKYGSVATPPGIPPLAFLIVPMFDLLVFAILFAAAIYYRRKPAVHKGLMLLTALNFLPPALARIPIAPLQALGPVWFFGLPTALALLCVGLDARRRGHLNKVFAAGTAFLICTYPGRLAVMTSEPWMSVATWLVRFV